MSRQPVAVGPSLMARISAAKVSLLILGTSAGAAVLAAAALAQGRIEIALVIAAGLVAAAAYTMLSFEAWCFLLLVTAVAGRGIVDLLSLPQSLSFAHYPIAVGFALAAQRRPADEIARPATRWLLSFVALAVIATVIAGSHPLRAALFLMIAGQPLLVLWAILRWAPEPRAIKRIVNIAIALLAIQIPLGLYQGLTIGWFDPVLGTLTGHGAGAHVLGGLFAIAGFVLLAGMMEGRLPLFVGAAGVAVCLAMVLAAGAMAVLVLSVLLITLFPLWGRRWTGRRSERANRPKRSVVGSVVIGLAVATGAAFLGGALVPGIYDRIPELLDVEELPERQMVAERAESDWLALLFGSGPGTSASRASILLAAPKEESPVEALGLPPTELGYEIFSQSRHEYGGSAEAAASGALAIIGDLGVIGFAGFVVLFVQIWRLLSKSRDWIAPAAKAALLLIGALIFLDNWLEYPEFALPFATLIGIALRPRGVSNVGEWAEEERSAAIAPARG